MTAFARILSATALVGAIAAPAATQPNYPAPESYPPDYGTQSQGSQVIGAVIDSLLGNRYNVSDRKAVSRCASAAIDQANRQFGPNVYAKGYGNGNNGYGNNGGYGHQKGYGTMRVTAITDVERKSRGLKVSGLIDSGMHYGPYGGGKGYSNRGYSKSDLNFRCSIDYRGSVSDVRVRQNDDYRRY